MDMPPAGPASLAPRHYTDPDIFAREQEGLFARSWQFVGFTDEIAETGAFLTRTIAGRPVLIQNFDGEIRAFRNVCSHRFARIQALERGIGPVRCPYHGWTYDRNGVPLGIPGNRECFGLSREDKEKLALTRYEVAVLGRFLFVRLEPGGPDPEAAFGPLAGWLHDISDRFAPPFAQEAQPWQADWKVGIENVLEVYHVDSIHPESFRSVVSGSWDCEYIGAHSAGVSGLTDGTRRWWQGIAKRLNLTPSHRFKDYDHALLFPNLAIGVTAGLMVSVQTYEPVAPGRFLLRYRLCLARPPQDGTAGSTAARKAVETHLTGLNRQLLDEDRRICEEVQIGTAHADRPALLGRNEARIRHFQEAWLSMGLAAG